MKTKWTVLIVAGAVVVVWAGQAVGQGPGRGQGWGPGPAHRAGGPNQAGVSTIPHRGGPMGLGGGVFCCPFGPAHSSVLGPLAWSLNLTDEQIKQIRSIYDQARIDANSVEQAVATARIALHETVASGATEAQIRAAAATLGTAVGHQAVLHAKVLTAAQAVLTDEQRKELDKIPERMATLQHNAQGPNPAGPGGNGGTVQHNGSNAPGAGQPAAHTAGPGGSMTLDQMFRAADANNDGVLTLEELNAFQGRTGGGQVRHQ
jgi:Spy/CpxP family protein refolding chaperone